jgi:hypothetical protein
MERDLARIAALMATRLEALRSLAEKITAGQQACVALDFSELQACDNEKERLCSEVSRIDAELVNLTGVEPRASFLSRLAGEELDGAQGEILQRIRRLAEESEATRVEVGRRNDVYKEFLRRARSKIKVMFNVVSHCLGIYPPWALPASGGLLWERGN